MADFRRADVTGVDWTGTDRTKVIWTEADLGRFAMEMNEHVQRLPESQFGVEIPGIPRSKRMPEGGFLISGTP